MVAYFHVNPLWIINDEHSKIRVDYLSLTRINILWNAVNYRHYFEISIPICISYKAICYKIASIPSKIDDSIAFLFLVYVSVNIWIGNIFASPVKLAYYQASVHLRIAQFN